MAEVIYAPDADDDLESIVDYIARDKPKAARKWLENLKKLAELLQMNPALVKSGPDTEFQAARRSVLDST